VAALSKAWTVFARSNPSRGVDVCVRLFCVCVVLCVGSAALRLADPTPKETYRLCKKDLETEEEARAQKKAVEPLNEWMNQ
jgi:hypothetical protein